MGSSIASSVWRNAIVTTASMLAGLDGDRIGSATWHGVGPPHPAPDRPTWGSSCAPLGTPAEPTPWTTASGQRLELPQLQIPGARHITLVLPHRIPAKDSICTRAESCVRPGHGGGEGEELPYFFRHFSP